VAGGHTSTEKKSVEENLLRKISIHSRLVDLLKVIAQKIFLLPFAHCSEVGAELLRERIFELENDA
jgi:hypothetical protein